MCHSWVILVALPGSLGWCFLDAQPSTSVHGALHGIPWHGAVTQGLAGDRLASPPSQATAHRTPPRSLRSCFPFKSTQGHPVLWVSSCGGGPHSGQNGACSQLPTLNMGGQVSWGSTSCYLEVALIVCSWSFAAWNAFLLLPLSAELCVFNGLEKPHMGENLLNLMLWYRGTSLMRNTSL